MATTPKASVPTAATNARAKPFCLHGAAVNVSDNGKSLGTITKLHVMPTGQGLEQNDYNSVLNRAEKYSLKYLACSILNETVVRKKSSGEEYRSYVHRVNYCLSRRISKDKDVDVRYNETRKKAHFGNLQRCGSVWTCPICAAQITEGRRLEVKSGFTNWLNGGGSVYMATFTNPHHYGDNLEHQLSGQKKAFKKFWEKTKVVKMLKCLGYKGRIVATEVTHGVNGWHPHYHVILFFNHEINIQGLQSFLAIEWQDACRKAGMKIPSLEHGVDVRDGTYADKYISKWGLEHEVTKGHVKKGREGSLTPFDLLRQSEDNPHYQRLFKEYADAFKGKHQLFWSKGLKKLLEVDVKTDEELATETDKDSVLVDEMDVTIFELVNKYRKHPDVLHAVELDKMDGGNRYFDLLWSLAEMQADEMRRNMTLSVP